MITPNSHVSRNAIIRVSASSLSKTLKRIVMDKPANPVRMLLTDDGVSIWTHDISGTMNLLLTDSKVDDLKVKEPCVLLISPDAFSDLLNTKFGNEIVQITTDANKPIEIKNRNGSRTVYHPADEDDCATVPDRWVMPKDKKGWVKIPQKDNEVCTTRITISRDSLSQGLVDMKVAKAPYIVFSFDKKSSTCSSGHWGAKNNQSYSSIEAEVEGEKVEINLSEILAGILSRCEGNTFVINKHKDVPFIVIECGDTTLIVAETIREV
tara:strand:+ start:8041 stop:8838 length:798 start_codon:yes stop_codon:yes gene_type:complete